MFEHKLLFLIVLLGICCLIYYFGELLDVLGWKNLQWQFFYGVHDPQRLFFLAPIIWAGYFFGCKKSIIVSVSSMLVMIPRSVFISIYPESLIRTLIFGISGIAIGLFIGTIRNRLFLGAIAIPSNDTNNAGTDGNTRNEVIVVRNIELDFFKHQVKRNNKIIKFTPTEFELLSYLVRNSGRIISHRELLQHVWGLEYGQEYEYLRTFVSRLRHKIENDPAKPELIITESGIGYRFC